ncbi:phage tailspike protein [Kosakonia cowanii]|uniref:phage tailspike protein n=1 Tax=Kosakonia cowanii TaxID=208223 RepID=UPI0028A12713|nr:phage tailspike protein [Kosakonia cowanii]
MADITANVVVTNPRPVFTDSRTFKAVANGKIYIGLIDTDPTIPANQIPVYVENEDGSLVQISQPLITNAGGKITYGGQVVKVVTSKGHSMAVYDAYNAEVDYIANVLKYDPDKLRQDLSQPTGASLVGVQPQGNLSQVIQFVTPEQFGAIGDGTPHPLSERYSTLAAAQAVYPFVTSLTQTIDWAACQAAENYARGKCPVRCPYAIYHFGNNGMLEQGAHSKWYGVENTPLSTQFGTTMIRAKSTVKPPFGKDAVVRVMDAAAAGSTDEFVRGIVFDGIHCSRGVARRTPTKNSGDIGYHANNAIKAKINISVSGAEYGLFGYICWGMTGTVRADSCHKGFYVDPASTTPEFTPATGATFTCANIRLEIDACTFGLVLRRAKYCKFHGFIEGAVASNSNYDSINETAIAATFWQCDSVDVQELGIEAWQGAHVYANASTVSVALSWTQDYKLLNTTGKHGPFQAMATLTGGTELFTLPTTDNSYFYCLNTARLKISNMTGDMSTSEFNTTYLVTVDANSGFIMENTSVYFGANLRLAPANWASIELINDRFIKFILAPSGYEYEGRGISYATTYSTQLINGGDGRVQLTPPVGWKIIGVEAWVIIGTQGQATSVAPVGIVSFSDTAVNLQTPVTTANTFSINYKLRLKVNK